MGSAGATLRKAVSLGKGLGETPAWALDPSGCRYLCPGHTGCHCLFCRSSQLAVGTARNRRWGRRRTLLFYVQVLYPRLRLALSWEQGEYQHLEDLTGSFQLG